MSNITTEIISSVLGTAKCISIYNNTVYKTLQELPKDSLLYGITQFTVMVLANYLFSRLLNYLI